MEPAFWHERWQRGEIGFHRSQPHPQLVQHFLRLPAHAREHLLVPLCGKSVDMAWLARQGARVSGTELSAMAINDFAREQGLSACVHADGDLLCHEMGSIRLWQGDHFALNRRQLGDARGFYDRAALVALPPDRRARYVEHLNQLLPAGSAGLLITFDYDPSQMDGPPFAVSGEEVRARYGDRWQIQALASHNVIAQHPGLQQRGLKTLQEQVWLLTC